MNVASCAPTRVWMFFSAQRPKAALPPAKLTSATMMPSRTRKRKMPALSAIAAMIPVVDNHVDRGDGGEVAGEERADHDADKERRVRLLGDQRQRNGDDGGHERPEGSDKLHDVSPFLCYKTQSKKIKP